MADNDKPSKFVCARCGQNVGFWYFGWKHQTGGQSGKTCGQKPKRQDVREVPAAQEAAQALKTDGTP